MTDSRESRLSLWILEHCLEMFARPIHLVYAIQRRPIPGFVPRGRAQRFVGRGKPVCGERLCHRAAVSLAPKLPLETLLDCVLIPGVEIDRERRRNPLYFLGPVVKEVGVRDEHARQAASMSLR